MSVAISVTGNKTKIVLYRVSAHSNYIAELHYESLLSVYSNGSSKQGGGGVGGGGLLPKYVKAP